MKTVIDWKHVNFSYGETAILKDVSLDIKSGESVAIVGHNGAGKTTLMKLLIGILHPNSGEIEQTEYIPYKLGFMPENSALYQHLTGLELMRYFARLKGVDVTTIPALLEKVKIDFAADRKISGYSKGMKQRILLAQALLGEPKILILDEPHSGLDPSSRDLFTEILQAYHAQGCTTILSSHTLDGLEDIVHKVIFINQGKIVLYGEVQDIVEKLALDNTMEVWLSEGVDPISVIEQVTSLIHSHEIKSDRVVFSYSPEDSMALLQAVSNLAVVEDVALKKANINTVYHYLYK